MRVDEFKRRVRIACLKLDFPGPKVIQERVGSIKLRIEFSKDRFIDVYFNEITGTLNSALVEKGRRILGINGYRQGIWHLHPVGKTRQHIPIAAMQIEQILKEYSTFQMQRRKLNS